MQPTPPKPKYRFYATLLDSYTNYTRSYIIWEKYWGWSKNPPHTPDEFLQIQFQSLIDRINRVPFDSEPADKGTAFNEVIDCMVEHRKSDKVAVERIYKVERDGAFEPGTNIPIFYEETTTDEVIGLRATYNNRTFDFDIRLCREFAGYFAGAMTQVLVSAVLPTAYGDVEVYGYIDELKPQSVHDIKTTGSYSVGKFKHNSQHLVYPYCLYMDGSTVRLFEYNVAEIDKYGRWKSFTESYMFVPERDIPVLTARCEELIRFIEEHRDLITDKKIFNSAS